MHDIMDINDIIAMHDIIANLNSAALESCFTTDWKILDKDWGLGTVIMRTKLNVVRNVW